MKQTAVEWLVEQMRLRRDEGLSLSFYDLEMFAKKAKQMEKEQIIEAYKADCDTLGHTNSFNVAAEQYYNKTFKSE